MADVDEQYLQAVSQDLLWLSENILKLSYLDVTSGERDRIIVFMKSLSRELKETTFTLRNAP
jgi:hypothetical protein